MNRKFRWLPPLLWGLLIAVLSLIPGGTGSLQLFGIPYADKIGHFVMYAIWAFLIFHSFDGHPNVSPSRAFWLTIILGTVVGILLEYGQYAMTLGRTFETADMLLNGLGSICGSLAGRVLKLNFYK